MSHCFREYWKKCFGSSRRTLPFCQQFLHFLFLSLLVPSFRFSLTRRFQDKRLSIGYGKRVINNLFREIRCAVKDGVLHTNCVCNTPSFHFPTPSARCPNQFLFQNFLMSICQMAPVFLMKSLRETVIPLSAFGHFPLGGSKGLLLVSPHGGGGRAACGEVGRGSFLHFPTFSYTPRAAFPRRCSSRSGSRGRVRASGRAPCRCGYPRSR